MPLRPIFVAGPLLALLGGAAQAFTLDVLHFNDFHSRVELINAFDFDLLRRRTRRPGNASAARRGSRRRWTPRVARSRGRAATCWC